MSKRILQSTRKKINQEYIKLRKDFSLFTQKGPKTYALSLSIPLTICTWIGIYFFPNNLPIQWTVFIFWFLSIITWASLALSRPNFIEFKKIFSWGFPIILILAICTRFLYLDIYPFVTIGDMVRDGSWDTAKLLYGEIDNIFGYGRYQSHGYVINIFIIPFYLVFENSALSFKTATAVFSILDIALIFYIGEKYFRKHTGLIASIILIGAQLHLFYARTEIVIISTSLLVSIFILLNLKVYHKTNFANILLLSLFIGFSFNFYSAIKPVAFLSFLTLLIIIFNHFLKKKTYLFTLASLLIIPLFIVVGFGPRLRYTTPDIFFNTKRIIHEEESYVPLENNIINFYEELSEKYPKSLMIYFYENSQSHYAKAKPLIPFSFGLFFLIGLFSWMNKKRELLLLVPPIFLVPLTNSAITDIINADHRLVLLLSYTSLAVATGVIYLIGKVQKQKVASFFIIFAISAFLYVNTFWNIYDFFYGEYANAQVNNSKPTQEFLLMHVNYLLEEEVDSEQVCLVMSSENYSVFDILHFKENFYYFNPTIEVTLAEDDDVESAEEIYISKGCDTSIFENSYVKFDRCHEYAKFICPDKNTQYNIFIEEQLL